MENIMAQLETLLKNAQDAKARRGILKAKAKIIAAQLKRVAAGLESNPETTELDAMLASTIAEMASELRDLRKVIDTLSYELQAIHGLGDIAHELLND